MWRILLEPEWYEAALEAACFFVYCFLYLDDHRCGVSRHPPFYRSLMSLLSYLYFLSIFNNVLPGEAIHSNQDKQVSKPPAPLLVASFPHNIVRKSSVKRRGIQLLLSRRCCEKVHRWQGNQRWVLAFAQTRQQVSLLTESGKGTRLNDMLDAQLVRL